MSIILSPTLDGITHLNVYSQGKTELGRFLTNFAVSPIDLPIDGKFQSIEGYWYWLSCQRNELRTLSGFAAKQFGRSVGARDWISTSEFQNKIKLAINYKLSANPEMEKRLAKCELPLTHYYVFNGVVRNCPEARWILEHLESFKC
jgi:hypothetical protein